MEENLEPTQSSHDEGPQEPVAKDKKPTRKSGVERLRALGHALMVAGGNHQAVIALGAIAIAKAQGRIQCGPHARRQTLLAMGQGLHSAGYAPASGTLGLMFSEMVAAEILGVRREASRPTSRGVIDEVWINKPPKSARPAQVTEEYFSLTWREGDVESVPMMVAAHAREERPRRPAEPTAEAPQDEPSVSPEYAAACEERDEELAIAQDARAAQEAMDSAQEPSRSYWAQDEGWGFEARA